MILPRRYIALFSLIAIFLVALFLVAPTYIHTMEQFEESSTTEEYPICPLLSSPHLESPSLSSSFSPSRDRSPNHLSIGSPEVVDSSPYKSDDISTDLLPHLFSQFWESPKKSWGFNSAHSNGSSLNTASKILTAPITPKSENRDHKNQAVMHDDNNQSEEISMALDLMATLLSESTATESWSRSSVLTNALQVPSCDNHERFEEHLLGSPNRTSALTPQSSAITPRTPGLLLSPTLLTPPKLSECHESDPSPMNTDEFSNSPVGYFSQTSPPILSSLWWANQPLSNVEPSTPLFMDTNSSVLQSQPYQAQSFDSNATTPCAAEALGMLLNASGCYPSFPTSSMPRIQATPEYYAVPDGGQSNGVLPNGLCHGSMDNQMMERRCVSPGHHPNIRSNRNHQMKPNREVEMNEKKINVSEACEMKQEANPRLKLRLRRFGKCHEGPTFWGMWEDERSRMVYVSWLPRTARANDRTEKKRCELVVSK